MGDNTIIRHEWSCCDIIVERQETRVSATRSATGTYVLSWTPSSGSNTYFVNGTVRNAGGFVSFNGTTTTGCNILTYNASGTATDIASGCHAMIMKFQSNTTTISFTTFRIIKNLYPLNNACTV